MLKQRRKWKALVSKKRTENKKQSCGEISRDFECCMYIVQFTARSCYLCDVTCYARKSIAIFAHHHNASFVINAFAFFSLSLCFDRCTLYMHQIWFICSNATLAVRTLISTNDACMHWTIKEWSNKNPACKEISTKYWKKTEKLIAKYRGINSD